MHLNKISVMAAAGFVAGMMWIGTASASIIPANLDIDFRTSAWNGADNENSYSVGNVTATAAPCGWLACAKLQQDSTDGLGVKLTFLDGNPDEVSILEELTITFVSGSQLLTGVWITDLYEAPDGVDGEDGEAILQLVVGSQTFTFNGNDSDQDNGELFVSFGGVLEATEVKFVSTNWPHDPGFDNDFSVAGFTTATAVPEPGTIALLGAGLLGLGLVRRRHAA